MSNDLVADNTGLIYCNGIFTGSCIVFPWNKELYMITAGHVIYGKDFKRVINCENWSIVDNKKTSHGVIEVIGDKAFAKEHDIVLVKLQCKSELKRFNPVRFSTTSRNPQLSFLFRGKFELGEEAATHTNITYNSIHHKKVNWFNCDIERAKLTNDVYKSGSDWLSGWSGSGLFLANHSVLVCSGVMVEIPEGGNNSQIVFSSISALKELGFEPEIEDSKFYDVDKTLNAKSLNELLKAVDEKVIDEWEKNTKNNIPLELINRKLGNLYTAETFVEHRRQIIKGLLAGQTYVATTLQKQEQIKELYDNSRNVYDLVDKKFYVRNSAEARGQLNSLQKEYEKFMEEQLKDKLSPAEIKILGIYDVYDWISKCSLDFLKDE